MSIKRVNTSFRLVTLVAVDGVITPNADLGNLFRHTATGDVTLASPVNGDEAQVLDVQVYASGGARNLTAGGATISIPSGAWWWGRLSFDEDHDSWILDDGTGIPGGGGGGSSYTDEQVRDVMGTALVAGANVTITPNDGADTITIAAATTGGAGIPASTVDAKGDLIAATANDNVARLAVGANRQTLFANSSASTGLAYANPHSVAPLVHAVGSSGTSLTIDASVTVGWIKTITLSGNCTFTLAGATSGEATTIELVLTQDATGSRTVTWPASVKWSGGAPVLSTAPGSIDRIVLTTYNGGTTWYADLVGKGYA